jgi:hypothetical protein
MIIRDNLWYAVGKTLTTLTSVINGLNAKD